ncbi:MAG TPA: hypothetical protein VM536_13870 [Chloroflexia bacterium]|nr:hypothetical protein [Chloroflexia bacterium]
MNDAGRHVDDVGALIDAALRHGRTHGLEVYLLRNSGLPGPRLNLQLVESFARAISMSATQSGRVVAAVAMLDAWAALPPTVAAVNTPSVVLPATAVRTYGSLAIADAAWWDDAAGRLHHAASDARWRVREMVAIALQQMLDADWTRTCSMMRRWMTTEDALVVRAAAAAVAEPRLLRAAHQAADALAVQEAALLWFAALPIARRHTEASQILRQALGYTISVAVAAAPAAGLALLAGLEGQRDSDLHWIWRENRKKSRLKHLIQGAPDAAV